jgi:hypothetical protein
VPAVRSMEPTVSMASVSTANCALAAPIFI